ncbi:MAG: hypothetical protein O2913_12195 [Chloroflexi bacterium]|nr:hypothetical protein [Chloroflexota bacterium]
MAGVVIKVYHRTSAASAILAHGFRDGEGTYFTDKVWRGVWLSDVPLDINEGAAGDTVLVLDIPARVFRRYEWVEESKPYKESLVPAAILNRYGSPRVRRKDWLL